MTILTNVGSNVHEDSLRIVVHCPHDLHHDLLLPDPRGEDAARHPLVHPGVLHADHCPQTCTTMVTRWRGVKMIHLCGERSCSHICVGLCRVTMSLLLSQLFFLILPFLLKQCYFLCFPRRQCPWPRVSSKTGEGSDRHITLPDECILFSYSWYWQKKTMMFSLGSRFQIDLDIKTDLTFESLINPGFPATCK